jgi:hypothetical protein
MGDDEAEKDRQQDRDRLPHAAQVQIDKQQQPQRGPQFEALRSDRKQAEDGVGAARDGDRDGEYVIDDQGRAGDQPRIRADQTGRDLVAAAPEGNSSITWL